MKKINTYLFLTGFIIILLLAFFAYTFVADSQAIHQVYVEIDDISEISPKITSATIKFTINVTNPTTRTINDLSSTFDIFIDENYIGSGSFDQLSIPKQSNIFHPVTVKVYYDGLADSVVDIIKNWVNDEDTKLIIKGTMESSIVFGLTTTSFSYTATST